MAKEHSKGKEEASIAPIEGNILPFFWADVE
jgi:hypothetical protein